MTRLVERRHGEPPCTLTGGRIVPLFSSTSDNFKLINDAYGHDVGDEVLTEVASSRLREAARHADMVARLGGDEFVMLFDVLAPDRDARMLANRALRSLRKGFVHDGETLSVTASIGAVVISDPETDVEDVLRDADIAMYSAKAKGKNQIAMFQPVMASARRIATWSLLPPRTTVTGGRGSMTGEHLPDSLNDFEILTRSMTKVLTGAP